MSRTQFPQSKARTYVPIVGAGVTDVGRVRSVNEDHLLLRPEATLWAVADGMGGHSAGDVASRLIVEHLEAVRPRPDPRSQKLDLVERLHEANAALRREAEARDGAVIGATVVCFVALGDRGLIAWCGDSRAYRIRGAHIERLSRDHSVVQELVDSGALAPQDAEAHPHAHILTRAVGTEDILRLDFETVRIEPGDYYLLCSDGLSRYVDDAEIAEIVDQARSPGKACDWLCAKANERGGKDNITVIVLACRK